MEQNNLKIIERTELVSDNGLSLGLQVNEILWTTLTLKKEEKTIILGEEDFEFVINSLIHAFETRKHKLMDEAINGARVFEICNFTQQQYRIMGRYAETSDSIALYVFAGNSWSRETDVETAVLQMSEKSRMQWLRELVEFSLKLKPQKDQRRRSQRWKKRRDKLAGKLKKLFGIR